MTGTLDVTVGTGNRASLFLRSALASLGLSLVLFMAVSAVAAPAAHAVDVTFADANLEAAVRSQLSPPILAIQPITDTDMGTLVSFSADDLGITDLGGLEYATNLTTLSLRDNQIADLTPVASLGNLATLALSSNQITNLTPIAGLVNLTYLDLGFNQINDAAPISGLSNLNVLSLSQNQISSISAIQALTHLSELHLSDNQIVDVSPLAGLPQLGYVQLGGNPLAGISALVLNSDFASGDQLYIRDTGLDMTVGSPARADVEALVSRGVYVDYDEPLVVEPVVFADANLESAVRARLSIPAGEPITATDMLALTGLNAVNAGIADLGGLEYATNLQQLDLSANQITSVAPLGTLTSLTSLTLGNNLITDITPLQGLTGLSWLVLYGNQIESIAPVAVLTNLATVGLSSNNISDMSPLLANPGITGAADRVEINFNYLDLAPDSQDVADILSLQARGVTVTFDPQVSVGERAYIDDAALEQAIRSEVTISAIMQITMNDMLGLTHLSATNRGITSLAGLQNAPNLTSLDVSGNLLTGIRPLLFNPGLGSGDVVNLTGNKLNVTAGSAAMTDINALVARGVQVEYIPQVMPFRVRFLSDPPNAASFLVNTTVPGNSVSGYTPAEGYSVTQYVDAGGSGQPVTADNQVFYRFVRWSDGVTSATRQFTNVSADATVTAEFLNVHESQGDPGCFVSGCHDSDRAPNALDWDSVTPGFDLGPQYVAIHDWYAGPGSENPDSENSCYLCHNNPPMSPAESGRACTDVCHDAVPHQGQAAGHAVTAASSQCTGCHGEDIVAVHGATADSTKCEACHDDAANWSKTADCNTGCHADKYDAGGNVVQHADPTTAHAGAVTPACTGCHSADITALHPDCDTCHATGTPTGATCATCHPTMTEPHGAGPFFDAEAYNPNYPGYLSWSWATTNIAGTTGSPHGNYGTTTNKCAVCHAVHRASPTGNVLTAVTDAFAGNRTKTCAFCHGSTAFSIKNVAVAADGTISPHGSCSRCHVESPHGVGASVYPVLTEHLLNTRADAAIANDLGTGSNGIVTADFDSGSAKGLTLGTGYLCNQCHSSGGAGINTVYAVNEAGATPAQNATTINNTTGHRVTAVATSDWNVDGSKGAYLTGRIAYNDANSCQACHDAKRANGAAAFPHGYVDAAGAYAPKSQPGASLIWLTRAGDADDPRELVPTPGSTSGTADVSVLTGDGTCLKCHISGDGTAGVGQSY